MTQFFTRPTKNLVHPGWPTNPYGHTHYVQLCNVRLFF